MMPNNLQIHEGVTEDEILDMLVSYADGETRVINLTEWNIDDIEDWALDFNVERCPSCGWWVNSHELIPDEDPLDEPDGYCMSCR
jgi:hypothetical protein